MHLGTPDNFSSRVAYGSSFPLVGPFEREPIMSIRYYSATGHLQHTGLKVENLFCIVCNCARGDMLHCPSLFKMRRDYQARCRSKDSCKKVGDDGRGQ